LRLWAAKNEEAIDGCPARRRNPAHDVGALDDESRIGGQ
jgi:hypothetical protein